MKRIYVILPFIISIVLVGGILLGIELAKKNFTNNTQLFNIKVNNDSKIEQVLDLIETQYVDSVNKTTLSDNALQHLIEELDPHSAYIPKEELAALNEPLEGNFDGIGVEFSIQKDTIVVVNPIPGGPSEILGIKAGDRIVKVNNELVAGIGIKNKDVVKKLRGERFTKVNVSILRNNQLPLIEYTITRDKIPLHSVDVSYMVGNDIGYIKITRFSQNTYSEFYTALIQLITSGCQKLILDLRGNGGGYLGSAIKIADEFLDENKLIVYTKGKAREIRKYYATSGGSFIHNPLIVLVDEGSASASEIVAGAMQDNDRATIIGRRTFGKGLVQEQIVFKDSSAMRLTTSRYYTPTGRCIQKPYTNGNTGKYFMDYYERVTNGELYNKDSIHFNDSLKYITPKGKIVYGGGGIMPDVFVPIDTSDITNYFSAISRKGLIRQFAFDYVDKHRNNLITNYTDIKQFKNNFTISQQILNNFYTYATNQGVSFNSSEASISEQIIKVQLKAFIGRYLFSDIGFYSIIHQIDETFLKAKNYLEKL